MTTVRAVTTEEKATLRSEPQWSRLFLAGLEKPPTVFAARINQAFATSASKDGVMEITYDGVTTGAYTDIVAGMTLWIGSAAGLNDIGEARIRKTPTSTVLYIGEESEIDLDDDLYLTVVDEFLLWPRHVKITSGVTYMDGDVVYSDQHSNFDPVPIMGSDIVADVESYPHVIQLDGSDSWVFGGTISAYLWSKNAGTLSSTSAANPTLTLASYPTNGLVRVNLRVTASNGKTFTAHRYIRVYDASHPPTNVFRLNSCEWNHDEGGISFDVEMFGDASGVRDRAPIILFARDYYGSTRIEIGQQDERENVIASGWIDGETIHYNKNENTVSFTVKGAHYWLDRMPGFPPGVEEQKTATGAWTSIPSLTVDKALWHLLHWRSTATMVMDVFLTDDGRYASAFEVPTESIWSQIKEIASTSILAVPGCDQYNRLYVNVDPQFVTVADRSAYPQVMTLTKKDWQNVIDIERVIVDQTALLDLSGVAVPTPNGQAIQYFSLSPGHVFSKHGSIDILDRLLLASQAQSNNLAGLAVGKSNNPYPDFQIELGENNRMIGVFPYQYVPIEIVSGDTSRGIEFDDRLIPRNISSAWDADNGGFFHQTITFEAESFPENAVTGEAPANNPIPPIPPQPPPPPPPPPGGGGTTDDGPPFMALSTWNFGMLYTETGQDDDPQWLLWNGGLSPTQYLGSDSASPPIRQIIRDPATGGFYMGVLDYGDAAYGANTRGCTHLFYSPGIGAPWTQLLYAGNIGGVTDPVTEKPRIISFGVSSGGQVMAIGGVEGDMRIFVGDSGGLEEVSTTPTGLDASRRLGALIYSLGKWLLLHAEDNAFGSRAWSRMGGGGAIDTDTSNDFGGIAESASDRSHWAIPLGESVLYWTYGDNLIWIAGQDPTTCVYSAGLLTGESSVDVNQCLIAAEPGGAYLMGGGRTVIGQRSSDGGASWGNIGTDGGMSTGYRVWANAGDANQFVAATSQKVMLTLDFGDSWVDKSGNLPYIAPLCSPNHLFAWY